jgi:glycosyltransferase involved in cell wall biosynthesis
MTGAHLAGRRIALVLGPSTGGIGRHVATLRDALRRAGAVPVVVGPADVLRRFGLRADGHPYETSKPAGAQGLRALLRNVDLVHAHGLRPGVTAALARPRAPLIVTWHNAVLGGHVARLQAWPAQRLAARAADVSLCVSPDLVEHVFRLGGSPRLAPVGAAPLPPPARAAAETRAEIGADGWALVVCVARLHHQKGLDVLIDAAAGIADHPRRPLVALVGEGPARGLLKARIQQRAAPVRLLGARSDVAGLLAAADLAVLPSRWEGSPLAAHEALAAGVPLIATAVGGVPLLVGDGARLVPPENASALAAALRSLLDDPISAAELAERGRRRAAAWPDAATTAEAVLAVYAELLDCR